ncbi:hypothetical protein GGX14DRAFT_185246 [Mycena pura]|uniref:Uncharacterized protein n=1 Tax=Mycena pura TaxID=153505 RepID=A0AAD6Y7K5_9AGAR|nr:hypothetical protein GGX14DRAFT_185246 [Mycena pura]
MPTLDTTSTPKLPPELERHIFELSARAYRSSVPAYLRVAHRVHVWIEPLLYNVLVVDHSTEVPDSSCPTPAESRDCAFLASHVRHLSIGVVSPSSSGNDRLHALLNACKNTQDLALWAPFPSPALLPLLHAMPLARLAADVTRLFGGPLRVNLAHPAFAALTHLDVLAAGFDDWRLWAGLAHMPRLSHLAFRDRLLPRVLRGALAHCARLRALGVIWSARRRAVDVREGEIVDVRLFMAICADRVEEWETAAWGGRDIWTRAEEFIAEKEAGKIKGRTIALALPFS